MSRRVSFDVTVVASEHIDEEDVRNIVEHRLGPLEDDEEFHSVIVGGGNMDDPEVEQILEILDELEEDELRQTLNAIEVWMDE